MIFEPDTELRELVRGILRLDGYEVEVVPDSARLLRRIGEEPAPRLLIAGYRIAMPKESGLLHVLRRTGCRLPVVLVGGETNVIWDSEAWHPGRVTVRIRTPLSIEDLVWTVRRALEAE